MPEAHKYVVYRAVPVFAGSVCLTRANRRGKGPKPYGGYVKTCDCCGRTNYTPIPLSGVKYDSMLDF